MAISGVHVPRGVALHMHGLHSVEYQRRKEEQAGVPAGSFGRRSRWAHSLKHAMEVLNAADDGVWKQRVADLPPGLCVDVYRGATAPPRGATLFEVKTSELKVFTPKALHRSLVRQLGTTHWYVQYGTAELTLKHVTMVVEQQAGTAAVREVTIFHPRHYLGRYPPLHISVVDDAIFE
jgi:hypothetical protein